MKSEELDKRIAAAAKENATELDLSDNELTMLPESIGKLKKLQTLHLTGNQLTTLPESIGKLKNLHSLELDGNQLTKLPESICQLGNLRWLNLSNNQLTIVPQSISQLKNLRTLLLQGNKLTTLPESIGRLKTLSMLFLMDNQLTTLPESICELKKIRMLELSRNELTHIPQKIFGLNLKIVVETAADPNGINLAENPLQSPPLEIASQGLEAVRDYFKQLEGDTVQLFEAKLLVVGQGGVGKTFLLNRLIYDETPSTVSTEGIDIHTWRFESAQTDEFQANFWDFGGQAIYHATHQFFLTKRSLYLFVWEATWMTTLAVLIIGSTRSKYSVVIHLSLSSRIK